MNPKIDCWEDYVRVSEFALHSPDLFWDAVGRRQLQWHKYWDLVSDCDYRTARVNWYTGAELNVSENCLDRQIQAGRGDKKALIWIGNHLGEERTLTFSELHGEVCRMSNALDNLGVKKGDRVAIYLPNIPELAISILACARIGAIHSVIFGGFSASSIRNRVLDCGARLIVTANGNYRGTKWIDLKGQVDEAMAMGCPSVERVIVLNRHPSHSYIRKSYDLPWEEWMAASVSVDHTAPSHSALDPLFILYTSGSTGVPKGVLHQMGGYLTYASYSNEIVFQPREEDVFWCTADIGWITGHTYVLYGPLSNGVTTVLYEGVPTYPDPGRFWEIVDRHQVSIFYSAPTAIRILAAAGDSFVQKHSRKSLRTLGTVGEPINPEAWNWYRDVVGEKRVSVVDTWWQTETGGILIAPLAGISSVKPGSASFPLPGIDIQILDDQGNLVQGESPGTLVVGRSWPGQMVGVYGDPKRFFETYFTQFPGYYGTGDGARRDREGFYWVIGRTDDVIKISGHRLGTAEIEAACMTHPSVAEAAAVGVPDVLTGEALHIFFVLKNEVLLLEQSVEQVERIGRELVQVVRKQVGALASPRKLQGVPGLPKTRSGKIVRRILKKMAQGEYEDLGDRTTLADSAVIEQMVMVLKKRTSQK